MTASVHFPPAATLRWLSEHAGFPASRLPARAELLLLLASAAEGDGAEPGSSKDILQRQRPALSVSLRAHALRRSQAHFKCDNSVNV